MVSGEARDGLAPFEACDRVVRIDVVHGVAKPDLHDDEGGHDADDLDKPAVEDDLLKSISQRGRREWGGKGLARAMGCLRSARTRMM